MYNELPYWMYMNKKRNKFMNCGGGGDISTTSPRHQRFYFEKCLFRFNILGLYLKFSVALELIAEGEEVVD